MRSLTQKIVLACMTVAITIYVIMLSRETMKMSNRIITNKSSVFIQIKEDPLPIEENWANEFGKQILKHLMGAKPSRIEQLRLDVLNLQKELWRRQENIDASPDVYFNGAMSIYYDEEAAHRLGQDDKRVIAVALKQRYNIQDNSQVFNCICSFNNAAVSPMGPVIAGVECSCLAPPLPTTLPPPIFNTELNASIICQNITMLQQTLESLVINNTVSFNNMTFTITNQMPISSGNTTLYSTLGINSTELETNTTLLTTSIPSVTSPTITTSAKDKTNPTTSDANGLDDFAFLESKFSLLPSIENTTTPIVDVNSTLTNENVNTTIPIYYVFGDLTLNSKTLPELLCKAEMNESKALLTNETSNGTVTTAASTTSALTTTAPIQVGTTTVDDNLL